jgi:hypothetical protein
MRKRWIAVPVLAAMVGAAQGVTAQANGEDRPQSGFSAASLCGNYGAIGTYGANVARALGWEKFDGRGGLTGRAIVNQPSPNDARSVVRIGLSGNYTVKSDGTGKMVLTVSLPGGATASVTEDFVITRAKELAGVQIATEIEDAQEQPSAVIDDSGLVLHRYTLRSKPGACRGE